MSAWRHEQFEDDSAPGVSWSLYRLLGPLSTEALQQSLNELVRRHEVLRTTYQADNGVPVPVVHPARPLEITMADLRALPNDEREVRTQEIINEAASRRFDLARDVMLRAKFDSAR